MFDGSHTDVDELPLASSFLTVLHCAAKHCGWCNAGLYIIDGQERDTAAGNAVLQTLL